MRHEANNVVAKTCVAVLTAIILFAIVFLVWFGPHKTEKVTITKNTIDATVIAEDDILEDANYVAPIFPSKLQSARFSVNAGELDFDFSLSSWTAYTIDFSNEHKTLELKLYNTDVVASYIEPPKVKDPKQPAVPEPEYIHIENGLKVFGDMQDHNITLENHRHNSDTLLTINFPYSVHLVKSKIRKGHPSSLLLNFKPSLHPKIVDEPLETDAEEQAIMIDYSDDPEAIYDTAKNLLYFKKYDEAILQLESDPLVILENDKAAAMLTKIYIIKKDYAEAIKLGARSLQLFPLNVEIRRLLAQVYFIQGNYEKAQETLQAFNPDMKQNLDYYELLASVMLKAEEYDVASGVYRGMLAINANKSDWWAGLGITLQAKDKTNLALEAYNKALRINNMDPNLLGYVKSQISILQ